MLATRVEPCLELRSIFELNVSIKGSTKWSVPAFAYKKPLVLVVGWQMGCDDFNNLCWEVHDLE